ncbi:MAG TPA: putative baseplate assembly protein [Gemmatimonadales bacterium]
MIYVCCNRKRGEAVRLHPTLNGIEYLEVLDDDAPAGSPRQRTIVVRCYKPVGGLDGDNVRIEGGTRIRPVIVEWAFPADTIAGQGVLTPAEAAFVADLDDPAQLLVVRTAAYGDFSTYTLRLVAGAGLDQPPANFDPVLSSVEFSFKAECPTPFDCARPRTCPPEARETPGFSYLAKDYASFRGLMLDRLALLLPRWTERNPADLGVALVELLAYAGDSLSYRQDAVATEAYLDTARSRVSVRRHARLVDYFMHDGSNARCWVQIQAQGAPLTIPAGTQLLSRASGLAGPVVTKGSREYDRALNAGAAVFETMHRAVLYPPNNTLFFYTWGDEACALPACATRATLKDGASPAERLRLRAGDVLILEERLGPETGSPSDADPTRRHAVRLTKVEPEATPVLTNGIETDRNLATAIEDPLTGQPIVKIEWGQEDALPFAFCLSAPRTDTELADQVFEDVSVAQGNIVLADHGLTIPDPEPLGEVPAQGRFTVAPTEPCFCDEADADVVLPTFRPSLRQAPVTQVGQVLLENGAVRRAVFDPNGSAGAAFRWDLRGVLPAIVVTSDGSERWTAERELLDSRPADRHFMAEVHDDGSTRLRFGDGELGMRPEAASPFTARYRVGNGTAGNIGAEVLAHLADGVSGINVASVLRVRNPLSASGGVDPETIEEVRQKAPFAFRTQQRAVTLDDYEEVALRYPGLQRAAARFRWTGSWRTVFVTLDPLGRDTVTPDPALKQKVRDHLERYRLAGYDLEVDNPRYVSLEIDLQVCVKRGYFGADVQQALLEVFSNRTRADGVKGVFHPDRFSFGQTVYLSPLFQAALAVDGVESVRCLTFRRLGQPDQNKALKEGRIPLSRLEIARLDNNPNFPEHGTFRVTTGGES